MRRLCAVVGAIHRCHVVHLDLYPSNIMWKKTDGAFDIKIIDWDTVHHDGECLHPRLHASLTQGYRAPLLHDVLETRLASREIDVITLAALWWAGAHPDLGPALRSAVKPDLDKAFHAACKGAMRRRLSGGGRSSVRRPYPPPFLSA